MRAVTREEVEGAYRSWLASKSRGLAERFDRHRVADPDGAAVEAVTWWWLEHLQGVRTEPGDRLGVGGPDFDCYSITDDRLLFSVEATAIRADRFTELTGVANGGDHFAGRIGPTSEAVRSEIVEKIRQAKKRDGPVVLAVGTTHAWSHELLDGDAAKRLLAGETSIVMSTKRTPGGVEAYMRTDFKESAFYVLDDSGDLSGAAKAISAVVLLAAPPGGMSVIGALNPWATHPLNVEDLSRVPFARGSLNVDEGTLTIDFTIGGPDPRASVLFDD